MVLHKFALPGGKVPAATGIRAAGRPPKAGRRTLFAAAAAPPGLPPRRLPRKPCPHRAQQFSACFYGKVFAFCGLCFCTDFALFAAGTERIARPPQGQANGSFLATLAACRFWAFAVGRNSSHPSKGKANGWGFYPLSPGFTNCGVKSPPSRRRASSRAGCGGRAVK